MTVDIKFPNGQVKKFKKGTSAKEIAGEIGIRNVIATKLNGVLKDLTIPISEDADILFLKYDDPEGKEVFWHTSAHILAQAVKRLYPDAKLTIGPTWESGYFYDIDMPGVHPEDLEKIEKEMEKIVHESLDVHRVELSKAEALKTFQDNPYKMELIKDSIDTQITAYKQGEFMDLCKGPHLPNTNMVKAFKLVKVSGAYWKGDQNNAQLQRIYGVSFPEKKQLTQYLEMMEEAAKRDHRVLGKRLELFMFHEWSPGSPIILPKGTIIYNLLLDFVREQYLKRGYQEVITPQLFNKALWELSGHWEHYRENMFLLNVDNEEFSLKPMNCPSHMLIFKSKTRSYRELPIRIADFCNLHRNELKGVLGGMTRVRKFSQDDTHIFCTQEQVESEISALIDFFRYIYVDTFKMPFKAYLSTKPEKAMGSDQQWVEAESALKSALSNNGLEFGIKEGEGAFYGPKIDIFIKDSLGREWQLTTIQLDFQMPGRMGAEYEGQDGRKHTPVVIHRALIGSFERFLGILTEHFAGKFPLWLSPEQVRVLCVSDKFNEYGASVVREMQQFGLRATLDSRTESINYKVREAQMDYVNYIVVVGEREINDAAVTVRTRDNKIIGTLNKDEFIAKVVAEVKDRTLVSKF